MFQYYKLNNYIEVSNLNGEIWKNYSNNIVIEKKLYRGPNSNVLFNDILFSILNAYKILKLWSYQHEI